MLLALFMCVVAVAGAAKERTAPEMQEPQTLVAGQTYMVYNVGSGLWLSYNSSSAIASSVPQRVQFVLYNGSYSLNFVDIGRRCYTYDNLQLTTWGTNDTDTHVYVEAVEGGYTFRPRNNNSNNQYLGVDSNGNLQRLLSSGNIVWQLYEERYGHLLRFYNALEQADAQGYNVDKYDAIYEDENSTNSQLLNAAIELERAIEFSNTLTKASNSEYPLLFTRTGAWWKVRKGYSNYVGLDYYYNSYWDDWSYVTDYSDDVRMHNHNSSSSMTQWDLPITMAVDGNALFYFSYYCDGNYNNPQLDILLDGELQRHVLYAEGNMSRRYVVGLTPGVHTITLRCQRAYGSSSSTRFWFYDFVCQKAGDEISVNLLEAGSLGTEVLYNVDNVNMVRRLKIKGPINDEDWSRIYMMTQLNSLDLSECTISEIKASQLSVDAHSSLSYLNTVKLPRSLKKIGDKAFYKTNLNDVDFPDGLETIGANAFQLTAITKALLPQTVRSIGTYAFSECAQLNEVFLPDSASVGTYAFNGCTALKKANLPKEMTNVPAYMFNNCQYLDTMAIGDKIETVGDYAFYQCYRMKMKSLPNTLRTINQYAFCNCDSLHEFTLPEGLTSVGQYAFAYSNYFHTPIPSTLKTIGTHAFENAFKLDTIRIVGSANVAEQAFVNCNEATTLIIEERATIGNNAFQNCAALDSVVISENVSLGTTVFNGCTNLRYIEFPTTYYTCTGQQLSNITGGKLEAVVFKSPTMVQGSAYTSFFSGVNTTGTKIYVPSFQRNNYRLDSYWYNWPIEALDPAEITDWTINQPMTFGASERFGGTPNLTFNTGGSLKVNGETEQVINNLTTHRNGNSFTQLLINCDNVSISGSYQQRYYTAKNTWNFITMPFDFRVGDVVSAAAAQMVLRHYDGANRATNGTGSNWKNLAADDIVTAGTGFIVMTSKDGWLYFNALDNAAKQNVVANRQLAKALEANPSATTANKGWNMVGNLWLTYYNNHKLNFTAPITVWTGSTYKAYSLIDDDYALRPLEAFFVQCPDDVDVLSFPTEGRQLTSVIESQNAARSEQPATTRRYLVDLVLNEDSLADETRIVLNEQASLDYEPHCDAGKFMTLDAQTSQLWSVRQGISYAINERPFDDGVVRLGFTAAHDGQYTIALKRNQAGTVILVDRLMGTKTDLSAGDYVFSADAGTTDVRFELHFDGNTVTGIAAETQSDQPAEVYTVDGRRIGLLPANGQLPKGIYMLRRGNVTEKVRF